MMKIKYIYSFILGVYLLISLTSCATKKDLIYFNQSVPKNQDSFQWSEIYIQPNDILSVKITVDVPELAVPYNIASTQQNGAQGASAQLQGYLVANDGTINIPILGVQMSRTSLSQTISNLKLVYNQDSIPPTISLEGNYLLVKEKNFEPSGFLNSIYSQAYLITSNEDFELLQISGQEIADLTQPDFQNKESLTAILFNDFEELASSKTYNKSKGALEASMNQYTKLFEYKANDSAQTVLVTFQYYLNQCCY